MVGGSGANEVCKESELKDAIFGSMSGAGKKLDAAIQKCEGQALPLWVKGQNKNFIDAVTSVGALGADINAFQRSMQIWSTINARVGFKLKTADEEALVAMSLKRSDATTWLATYSIVLLLEAKEWETMNNQTVNVKGSPEAHLHKTMTDALAAASTTEGVKLSLDLKAMADQLLLRGSLAASGSA
jgi:hypothetical protein